MQKWCVICWHKRNNPEQADYKMTVIPDIAARDGGHFQPSMLSVYLYYFIIYRSSSVTCTLSPTCQDSFTV